ncbi:hypothetical protein ACH6CV_04650 [Bacillota bacterium Meth-B3]|nr:hypothetical protein [Christensenellaceae bacterium]MEA5065311.1 hypothetical protein [Eubacteriales bacterium]MEA5068847.1 hypothetical protein [Christensenellaceae bacterium]
MRRIWPLVLTVLALLIDTSVVPMLTDHWAVPLMLPTTVSVLGLLLGRTNGMLYGMIGGLLMDITASYPLGLMTGLLIATGYLSGLAGRRFQRYLLTAVFAPIVCFALYESVLALYALLAGQVLGTTALRGALARIAVQTLLAQFLYLLYNRMLKPSWSRYAAR